MTRTHLPEHLVDPVSGDSIGDALGDIDAGQPIVYVPAISQRRVAAPVAVRSHQSDCRGRGEFVQLRLIGTRHRRPDFSGILIAAGKRIVPGCFQPLDEAGCLPLVPMDDRRGDGRRGEDYCQTSE